MHASKFFLKILGEKKMKKIVILKTGGTIKSLIPNKGDFEHWIISGMNVPEDSLTVIDVRNSTYFPDYSELSGIVITGSHSMITKHHEWNERTAEWLFPAVEKEIPVLGICYGHQLLAYTLGGEVGDNPKGPEYGTVSLQLTNQSKEDVLFQEFSDSIKVHVTHSQSVLTLPKNAKRLASSKMDPNQAFVYGKNAWGIQFHPEFDKEVVLSYIHTFQEMLLKEGQDINLIERQVVETKQSFGILRRFANVVQKREGKLLISK